MNSISKIESLSEKEIISLIQQSLVEAEEIRDKKKLKKKYLDKGGIISQIFQSVVREKDLERKKKLGNLVNQ